MNLSLRELLLFVGICCLLVPEGQVLWGKLFQSKDESTTAIRWNTEILDYEPEMEYFTSLNFDPESIDPNDLDIYLENFERGWRDSIKSFIVGDVQISRVSMIPWHGGYFRTNDYVMRKSPEDFEPSHSSWIGMEQYGKIKGWAHCFSQLAPIINAHGSDGAREILKPVPPDPTLRYILVGLMVIALLWHTVRKSKAGKTESKLSS